MSITAFDTNRDTFEPGQQDYSALQAGPDAATGHEIFEADMRQAEATAQAPAAEQTRSATLAENRAEIGAFMGVEPGGTYIYTGQTHATAAVPTDYENGPHRPGSQQEAGADDLSGLEAFNKDMNTAEEAAAAAAEITGRDAEASRAMGGRSL